MNKFNMMHMLRSSQNTMKFKKNKLYFVERNKNSHASAQSLTENAYDQFNFCAAIELMQDIVNCH